MVLSPTTWSEPLAQPSQTEAAQTEAAQNEESQTTAAGPATEQPEIRRENGQREVFCGLTARRLSRNVWKLSRSSEDSEKASTTSFGEGFRRRL